MVVKLITCMVVRVFPVRYGMVRISGKAFCHGQGIGFAVVNNLDGYDEISLTDEFKVMTNRYETIYKPSELGFSLARQEELYGGNTPEEASKIFNNVLENKATKAQTDCVLINASFAIQAMEPAKPIEECVAIARESLESGKALNTLKKFVELNS